ncbi:hypothetical protein [Calycomorphotria hydatis]|uniref:Uncharacterized protein n=1 Tax=Calycomorphotria hydatis TaxID=2528027 RepID=A0A517T5C4_9PLAN|nr:hypothetical protein [Calycomorphotria hydatis]QDT63582.1 hypothetical protein V22_08060 [Calycomorphotria hydatis]
MATDSMPYHYQMGVNELGTEVSLCNQRQRLARAATHITVS